MVTDIHSNYTSPAGREFTLTAGRFAGIHPASIVLDMGCGYGEGVCTITREFRCKAIAVDINRENISFAQELAIEKRVGHLVEFICKDITQCAFSQNQFDLVFAEGGVLSSINRQKGIALAHSWLMQSGWFAFSDLVLLSKNTPSEVLTIFNHESFKYETEESYRDLITAGGFDILLMCLVPPSGWDNYYAHMARRLEDEKGFFADKRIKLAFHKEIDTFYRLEGFRYIGYLVCIARKKSPTPFSRKNRLL